MPSAMAALRARMRREAGAIGTGRPRRPAGGEDCEEEETMRFRMSLCSAAMALLILPGVASAAGPDARDATLDGASEGPPRAPAGAGGGRGGLSSHQPP